MTADMPPTDTGLYRLSTRGGDDAASDAGRLAGPPTRPAITWCACRCTGRDWPCVLLGDWAEWSLRCTDGCWTLRVVRCGTRQRAVVTT